MRNFFILITSLNLFFTAHAVEFSLLNPYAEPYTPPKKNCVIPMAKTTRNGYPLWAPLNKVLELEKTQCAHLHLETFEPYLEAYFWVAVYNGYPTAAYKIGIVLFKNILLLNTTSFANLSDCSSIETLHILSKFYSFLAKNRPDLFSTEDQKCFATYAAKLKPK